MNNSEVPSSSLQSEAPFAWTARGALIDSDWQRESNAELCAAFESLPIDGASSNVEPGIASPLPAVWEAIASWMQRRLFDGPGYVLIRDLPFERWGVERARHMVWSVAQALGRPVTQTASGERVVDVQDQSRTSQTPRQFKTSQELRLHTDPCSDLIGLSCLRAAAKGGESVLSSAVSVHDAMLEQCPHLLDLLYRGFHWHRFGEGRPSDPPYTEELVPIFARDHGGVACRYVRSAIVAGHQAAGRPLSAEQVRALDTLDRLASSPELRHAFRMRSGDMLWVNNFKVFHARTEFIDHAPPLPPRHLLRLWLEAPSANERAPARLNFFNGGACGMPVTGAQAAYDMNALRTDAASGGVARLGISSVN